MNIMKCLFVLTWGTMSVAADNRIIIYLRHAPDDVLIKVEKEAVDKNIASKIAAMDKVAPGQISQKMMKYALQRYMRPPLSGFQAFYAGFSDISNHDGLISFPLRHTTPKVYVAIASAIKANMVKGNTVANYEYVSDKPEDVMIYSFAIKQDAKQASYWEVVQEKVPADKKINPLTVVILTKTKNIYVPVGEFMAPPNQQLVLPPMYVLARSETEELLLKNLDLGRYFEPIISDKKKASDMVVQKMLTNI